MATKYNDIIALRGGKASYSIENEKGDEWESFIPNEQFNGVLSTVLKSVRGNDIDNHKSFWINGTYGTGKSHAVAVISHLLGDDVNTIQQWVNYEYGDDRFTQLRNRIYSLRKKIRLLTVKVYGLNTMTDAGDFALVLQKAVTTTLRRAGLDELCVPTDFETYIEQINKNTTIWDHLIKNNSHLSSIVTSREHLIANLQQNDIDTYRRVNATLREAGLDIRLDNQKVDQWLVDVQNKLREDGKYNGLLIIWDEFTDVMTSAIGMPVLKALQELAEKFMNEENSSFLFLISHPSAFDKLGMEQMKQTDGRYHRMKYNMESVSAFKIMSRKFEVKDKQLHERLRQDFYQKNSDLLDVFTQNSNDPKSTKEDLQNLYPLHPGTANLATHYATVVGSSSRSVFEFLGQNDAIRTFLDNEECFHNKYTITADYLWDYVLKVFQDDVSNYGAVTERFNSYEKQVSAKGNTFFAIFKGILLLNAFNNVSGENNQGLVTPSEKNIRYLFEGTQYENDVVTVLQWFSTEGIIQRAPGGLYSVQFSALPSGEIEEKKNEMRRVQFQYTYQILNFTDEPKNLFQKQYMQNVIRPYSFKFYSDVNNDSSLRSQIKNGHKDTKKCNLFFALMMAKNNDELSHLRTFAEGCANDKADEGLKDIVFVVFDAVLGDKKYEQFIEYQANYACASNHNLLDQQKVHLDHAIAMVKEWIDATRLNNATIYIKTDKGSTTHPFPASQLPNIINSTISPTIFPYAPDSYEMLRQKAPNTFWKAQKSKEIVRTFLSATTKTEISQVNAQMRPIQYLIQDCLDDNLEWKPGVPNEHPFKKVFDTINNIIEHADKSLPFDFSDKFSLLTKPPFGFYGCFATMAMVAFSLRPWVGKIFDLQGKPRKADALRDDIDLLFKVWDDNKSPNGKLRFKFQTPEESKLCNELTTLFNLNKTGGKYSNVTSLNDARYAIIADYLATQDAPLWAIKYVPKGFAFMPRPVNITDKIKQLVDNIVAICTVKDSQSSKLIKDTLALIEEQRIEIRNILNIKNIFKEGFNSYLMQLDRVKIKESELDSVRNYIKEHLELSVGYWTEDEVKTKAQEWRLEQYNMQTHPPTPPAHPIYQQTSIPVKPVSSSSTSYQADLTAKRNKAMERIAQIDHLSEAKTLLITICKEGDERLLNIIINAQYIEHV